MLTPSPRSLGVGLSRHDASPLESYFGAPVRLAATFQHELAKWTIDRHPSQRAYLILAR
jgi:hypothetical protein